MVDQNPGMSETIILGSIEKDAKALLDLHKYAEFQALKGSNGNDHSSNTEKYVSTVVALYSNIKSKYPDMNPDEIVRWVKE